MTANDRFERILPDLLAELGRADATDLVADVLTTTATIRQRPGWTKSQWWTSEPAAPSALGVLSDSDRSLRRILLPPLLGALPRAVRVATLVALMLASLAAAAYVGSRLMWSPDSAPRSYRGELVPAPDMTTSRWTSSVVTLADGRVLVVGGNAGLTPTAEVLDLAAGRSTSVGPLVSAADSLSIGSMIRLRDGRVLLLGTRQRTDVPMAFAQLFDPRTLQFSAAGPMVGPGQGAMAMLSDGRVLIAGGTAANDSNNSLPSAEIFDPVTSTFTPTGSMLSSRVAFSMTTLRDGRVLVVGGQVASADGAVDIGDAEVYDPASGTFAATDAMASSRGSNLAVRLADGRVLVMEVSHGGDLAPGRTQIWDPTTGTFTPGTDTPRRAGTATLLQDGTVFMTGEWNAIYLADGSIAPASGTWSGIHDPSTGVTRETAAPHGWSPTSTLLGDGRVLLVGGLADGLVRPESGGHLAPAIAAVEVFQ